MEQDEQCMRKAAHLMVSSLAGQLALVTCREPMRVSLLEMLRSLLQPALEPVALEHAATVRPRVASGLLATCWKPNVREPAGVAALAAAPRAGARRHKALHFAEVLCTRQSAFKGCSPFHFQAHYPQNSLVQQPCSFDGLARYTIR